jgi:sulfofructose kinase
MTRPPSAPVRILGVGHVSQDLIFQVPAFPTHPGKYPATAMTATVGGMTANACVAAARLGAEVSIISPVGEDAVVEDFRRHFAAEGVDASGLVPLPGTVSSLSTILVNSGGDRIIVSRRSDAIQAPAPGDWSERLRGVDRLLVDPRCPQWALAALKAAWVQGVGSVLDGDLSPRDDLLSLVPWADWAVFSAGGLRVLAKNLPLDEAAQAASDWDRNDVEGASAVAAWGPDLAQARQLGARVAVVTLGAGGLVWQDEAGQTQWMPASPADPDHPVIDTLAAGDTFHGALAVALAEGQSASASLRWASLAAALKCRRPGGVLGAPTRAELDAALSAPAVQ